MKTRLLSAHIGYLFTEVGLEERFALARAAGFDAVEHPDPQVVPAGRMRDLLAQNGLVFAQMSSGFGNPGEKGLAALEGRQKQFQESFRRALDYAELVDCPLLHLMAGVPIGSQVLSARETYLDNLRFAVEECRTRPVKVLVEAICHTAVPGYFVSTLSEAVMLANDVAPGEINFLVDTFHAAASGTNLMEFLSKYSVQVGHVHIADFPGRHEPGSGTIDFDGFLLELDRRNYSGALGFEYVPTSTTSSSLRWLPHWTS